MSRLYDILNALVGRPYVTSQGTTSSGWRYRKWNNGFIEAWKESHAFGTVSPTVWSSPVRYYSIAAKPISIPSEIGFTSPPAVLVMSKSLDWWPVAMSTGTSTTSISIGRFATVASTDKDLTVSLYVYGS